MHKKFVLVVSITLAIVLGVGLAGCSDSENKSASSEIEVSSEVASVNELVLVSYNDITRGVRFYTFYDPDTYVMYKLTTTGHLDGGVSLTVMVNPDGTPKLYEPQD